MKPLLVMLACVSVVFSLYGCGEKESAENVIPKEEAKKEDSIKEPIKEAVEETPKIPKGMALSPITGQPINEKAASRAPFAVVINNLHKALPQSGIGQASMYYEALAEGEITRIVAVFEDFDAKKIGPIRSARDYFTYFALDNGAVFVHHGGSETGYAAIKNRGISNLDGMGDNAFWRDKQRMNAAGMYEHSSYTDAAGLFESAHKRGYKMERKTEPMFIFYDEETVLGGEAIAAKIVTLPYSYYQTSVFAYDEATGLYKRSQSGKEQIDELTGEVLTVKNVIVQLAKVAHIAGDGAGRRDIDLVGSGTGVFITNGKGRNITWEKPDYKTPTRWYDEKGHRLKINTGKTWICVVPEDISYSCE